ncbi:MAG: cytochrome c3 family protein, partial [Nitrospiria bacterium]
NPDELNSHFGDRRTGVFDDSRLKPGATNLHDGEAPVVAERACLVCHDPHTRQGAVRILREGVDPAGNVSIETTCFQCHQPQETSILQAPTRAPDIQTQFFKDREGNGNHGTSPTGSAMDLTLGLGHQPVFVDLPKEGVQLGSDNLVPSFFGGPFQVPAGNKDTNLTPGVPNTPDTSHVECVDCHNMHRVTRRNRFQGMPGITIRTGIVAKQVVVEGRKSPKRVDEDREPYLFEVCLRCHGNTFNNHVREALFTAVGTGKIVQARGNSPINPALGVNAHGSNKRKEFDPDSTPFYRENFRVQDLANPAGPLVLDPNPPASNTSFHPVFQQGRNQSGVLNNFNLFVDVPTQQGQMMGGFGSQANFDGSGRVSGHDGSGGLSREATIHCPDCHNTDLFGTFIGGIPLFKGLGVGGFPLGVNFPDYPGPISFDDTRGTAYRRPTDRSPSIPEEPTGVRTASLNDPKTAQGPHGSIYKRILRANYDTNIGTADAKPPGTVAGQYNPQNFALCFNCHNEAAFITPYWETQNCPPSGGAEQGTPAPRSRLTNFYRCGTLNVDGNGTTGGNLHMLHLIGRTNARCHECHNNVHSNVEAGNTIFVGMNDAKFKADNPGHEMSSHLLNFQPNIRGSRVPSQPMWGAGNIVNGPDGGQVGADPDNDFNHPTDPGKRHRGPGCNLRCHGFNMNHNTDAHSVRNGEK